MEIKVENSLPHGRKKNHMPLLAGVFLCDLYFNCRVGFLQSSKEWGHGFACLKIDRPVFDLDDDVVIEFSVERMKNVIGRTRAVVLGISPIEMMVVNKCTVKKNSSVWFQCARNTIRSIGWSASVAGRARTAFRICFHHKPTEIRNFLIDLVHFFLPPIGNAGIEWIKCIQAAD